MDRLNTGNKFECIEDNVFPENLNMAAVDEIEGDVEILIRTVKEGTQCHMYGLSYERCQRLLVFGSVTKSVKDLNQTPSPNEFQMK